MDSNGFFSSDYGILMWFMKNDPLGMQSSYLNWGIDTTKKNSKKYGHMRFWTIDYSDYCDEYIVTIVLLLFSIIIIIMIIDDCYIYYHGYDGTI